jgi:small subunit ribosomal protein S3
VGQKVNPLGYRLHHDRPPLALVRRLDEAGSRYRDYVGEDVRSASSWSTGLERAGIAKVEIEHA